jgi:hypothetical protein
MEAIYDDVNKNIGFSAFAPIQPASGAMFSARRRLRLKDSSDAPPTAVPESDVG